MYPTIIGNAAEGQLLREPQSCLGPAFAQATYQFFVTQTSTPANVYQDGDLTTPFPITGVVTADNFGRFPPIYLDTSVIYGVQFYDTNNTLIWTVDPYVPPLATNGTSSNSATGINITPTGEATILAPSSGGTGVTLTVNAGNPGTVPLALNGLVPGSSAIVVNNSATTGTRTATFTATNKPGTATSSPAGWLPIMCDGVQYYTPIWHGNNFSPYVASPSAQGQNIVGQSVNFGGAGATTVTGGTSGNWFQPNDTNIGAGYYINITKTSGLSGLAFSAAQGSWTNIGSGGLTISSNAGAKITGSYQLSSSNTGSPVVANGTITLSGNNGVQSNSYNVTAPIGFGSNGTTSSGSGAQSNWYLPTTSSVGGSYWINISRTGGTAGVNFSAAQGAWTNITNAGLSIGLSSATGGVYATGTYQISSNSGGTAVLGSGTITLMNVDVESPNWSGLAPLNLGGSGTATLNGASTSAWYSPTTSGVGAGYWFNITRTGSTPPGINFTAAQGAWTNISSGGLTINISGYTGDVGTVDAVGSWKISSSATGTPVVGSGTITLSVSGLTVIHVYTSGSGTEVIPTGTTTVNAEAFGAGSGGGAGTVTSGRVLSGGGGGSGALCKSIKSASSLGGTGKTFSYSVGVGGANGTNSTITAGTVTGWTAITAGAGVAGSNAVGLSNGAAGPGGTATGGVTTNTNGNAGTGINGGAGITGTISGDRSPYGAGGDGHAGTGSGSPGANGAVVFYYQ